MNDKAILLIGTVLFYYCIVYTLLTVVYLLTTSNRGKSSNRLAMVSQYFTTKKYAAIDNILFKIFKVFMLLAVIISHPILLFIILSYINNLILLLTMRSTYPDAKTLSLKYIFNPFKQFEALFLVLDRGQDYPSYSRGLWLCLFIVSVTIPFAPIVLIAIYQLMPLMIYYSIFIQITESSVRKNTSIVFTMLFNFFTLNVFMPLYISLKLMILSNKVLKG